MLAGNVFFAGDSITVGLPGYVDVAGTKFVEAKGGRTAKQIQQAVAANPSIGQANTLVVLGGTNDIGTSLDARAIFASLVATWQLGKGKGLRVIAMTVPPCKGYVGFTDFNAVNAKRRELNGMIASSGVPDMIVDLEGLLGDPTDHDKLSSRHDAGDHLHPNKVTMGAALNTYFDSHTFGTAKPALPPPNYTGVVWGVGIALAAGAIVYKTLPASRTETEKP